MLQETSQGEYVRIWMWAVGEQFPWETAFPVISEKCCIGNYGGRTFQANRATYKKALMWRKKQIKVFLGKLGETQFIAQLHMKKNDIKWGRGGGTQGLHHAASNGNAQLGFYSMPNGKPQEYFKPDTK